MTTQLLRAKPEGVSDLSRIIGNSEVSAFLQCERKHFYSFLQKLEPTSHGEALTRGIIGHEALEIYYKHLMDTRSADPIDVNTAKEQATNAVLKYLDEPNVNKVMLLDLITLLNRYWAFYPADEFMEIMAVEAAYEIPVNDDYNFGMRLDLLVKNKSGEIELIDHKFVYDFYSNAVVEMNMQMPKYIGTLRFNGIPVKRGVLNQIRYRMKKGGNTDAELFRRTPITPNSNKVHRNMDEQFKVSERIMKRRVMTPEAQESEAVRTANQMNCKNCSFQIMCNAELMGSDTALMRRVNFKSNTYVERQNPSLLEIEE